MLVNLHICKCQEPFFFKFYQKLVFLMKLIETHKLNLLCRNAENLNLGICESYGSVRFIM